jgi:hypothetical protein
LVRRAEIVQSQQRRIRSGIHFLNLKNFSRKQKMASAQPNVPPTSTGLTQADQNVFGMIFGKQTCVNPWANFGMYIAFAVILALVFALMAYVPVDKYMEGYIKNPNGRLGAKVLVFFLIAWLLVWLFGMWFQTHPSCSEK